MNNDAVKVNQINFKEAIPSLRLLESFSIALSIQCLIPALIGVLILKAIDTAPSPPPTNPGTGFIALASDFAPGLQTLIPEFQKLVVLGFSGGASIAVPWLLRLLVLGFTGLAIARSAGLHFCASRRSGVFRAFRHATRQWKPLVVSILLFSLLMALAVFAFWMILGITKTLCGPTALSVITGTPTWLAAIGLIVSGCILGTGWLLSLAAIGVDSCSGSEALSRGISYVLSRFQRTVVYGTCLYLMIQVSSIVVMYLLAIAGLLATQAGHRTLNSTGIGEFGFVSFVTIATQSWFFSLFFSGITVIYVLLRSIEDGVSLREFDSEKPADGQKTSIALQ